MGAILMPVFHIGVRLAGFNPFSWEPFMEIVDIQFCYSLVLLATYKLATRLSFHVHGADLRSPIIVAF